MWRRHPPRRLPAPRRLQRPRRPRLPSPRRRLPQRRRCSLPHAVDDVAEAGCDKQPQLADRRPALAAGRPQEGCPREGLDALAASLPPRRAVLPNHHKGNAPAWGWPALSAQPPNPEKEHSSQERPVASIHMQRHRAAGLIPVLPSVVGCEILVTQHKMGKRTSMDTGAADNC